mmetsp:Transcript_2647/g.6118  ORF Transcript_2647/g.6118 Transcript_2647/m.6118 type:complete len:82 (+) Transcript_2647:1-246(+)
MGGSAGWELGGQKAGEGACTKTSMYIKASAHARALLDEGLGCVCQGVGARACARVLAYFPRSKLGALRQALLAAASSEIVI